MFGINRSTTTTLDSKEAVAALMLAAVAADGVITEEEVMGFQSAVNRMSMFRKQNQQDFSKMMNKLLGIVKREGPEALMSMAVGSVPENYKATAFALCADLVTGDGDVDPAEEKLLEGMYKALSLDEAMAVRILEVMAVKNKV
ncbi:MAG: tellurite resistance TerB family protein [Candidatus Eremiobacterota bacterium]